MNVLVRLIQWLCLATPLYANDLLKNLPADSWYRAESTQMRKVCTSETEYPKVQGSSGCRVVMDGWSGATYDQVGKRFWVWGGGHGDYYGNELYVFHVENLAWSRFTEPSPITTLSADPMPDGKPISRHTYDGLAYLDHVNRFFAFGGSMAGNGYGTQITWTFDPNTKTWFNQEPKGNENRPSTNCCNFTGEYDPRTKKVFMRDPHWLCAFDFDQNTWSHVLPWDHTWSGMKTVVDSKRHLLFSVGATEFLVYDIQANRDVSSLWKTTGDTTLIGQNSIGLAYDPLADALVGWMGGGVYVLDLATKVWSRKTSNGAPNTPIATGTYGRFRYIPDDNVFMLANGIDQDIYFYKHTPGSGPLPTIELHQIHIQPKQKRSHWVDANGRSLIGIPNLPPLISFPRSIP